MTTFLQFYPLTCQDSTPECCTDHRKLSEAFAVKWEDGSIGNIEIRFLKFKVSIWNEAVLAAALAKCDNINALFETG